MINFVYKNRISFPLELFLSNNKIIRDHPKILTIFPRELFLLQHLSAADKVIKIILPVSLCFIAENYTDHNFLNNITCK